MDEREKALKELEFDARGNIVTRPVIGWTVSELAAMSILLRIQYLERSEEFETGGKALQLVLTPSQSVELAEALRSRAARILARGAGRSS